MNKQEYHKYLRSADWLIKKSELVNTYVQNGWSVECLYCGSKENLQVNHISYENIGNEILTDGRIWELVFACKNCHWKYHFEKDFEKKWMDRIKPEIMAYLETLQTNEQKNI